MKIKRIITLLLALAMICTACAMFASCTEKEGEEDGSKIEVESNPSVTFSFKIKDSRSGKVVYKEDDYTYVCVQEPTITNILAWYCEIDYSPSDKLSFKLSEDGTTVAQLADMKAGTSDDGYYYFMFLIAGEEISGSPSAYTIKDGDSLTIEYKLASASK